MPDTYQGSLKSFRVLDIYCLNVRVKFMLCALLIIPFAGDADTNSEWDTLNPGPPHFLVELRVEFDIFSLHLFAGKGLDFFDGPRSALFKSATMNLGNSVSTEF